VKTDASNVLPFRPPLKEKGQWISEEIFHNGDAYFSHLILAMDHAITSIDFEMYLFELDALGRRVLEALCKVASRGVRVRILVDGVGSPDWNRNTLKELTDRGVEARIFRPYPWVRMGMKAYPKLLNLRNLFRWFRVLNRRDHRKMCLIDGKIAWAGSFNITRDHLQEFVGEEAWRDTGIHVEGAEVESLCLAFERAWTRGWSPFRNRQNRARPPRIRKEDWRRPDALVRLNFAFLRRQYHEGLLHRIWSSRLRVWITTAYFIPERPLIRALRAASWAGVDVRVIVPYKSDVRFVRWITFAVLRGLLRSGVRVFEFHPHVLHAKTVLIDEWATIGSCNLNYRSLHHDLEVDIVVEKKESVESLRKQFERDQAFSEELTLDKVRDKFWLERWLGRIFFFLRYWM